MKNPVLVIFIIWLYGCNGQASVGKPHPSKIVTDSIAAGYSTISVSELRHYKAVIEDFADSLFSSERFNGSLLVAKNGEIIYEKYNGFLDPRKKRDSLTPSSPFHLASVSKTFTAMAILKLQEEGKLHINDTLTTYLPGFPLKGVTIKSLLNHRSGIPNYVHYMEKLGWDRKRPISNRDVLDFLIANHKRIQIAKPDKGFSYSNTNYALLALIIEKASGQSYANYLRQSIFEPFNMKDTYAYTIADSARSLKSFFSNGTPYAFDYLDNVYGDKNIYSTARDLLKWDQALYGGRYLQQQTLDSAYAGYSFEKPGIHNYGLGWRMFLLDSHKKFIYHNGWWHGNRAAFYRLPDDKATIIALSNNDYLKVYSTKTIANIFGPYFNDPEEEKAAEAENPNSALARKAYGGKR